MSILRDMRFRLKICLKLQIPYYHLLNLRLLGATNGNHGQTVMHLYIFF